MSLKWKGFENSFPENTLVNLFNKNNYNDVKEQIDISELLLYYS